MSKSSTTTPSEQETVKDKDTVTETSAASSTASTKAKARKGKGRDKEDQSTDSDSDVGAASTAHLGLEIVTLPNGLYKVKNKAGGTPPKQFKGMFTGLGRMTKKINDYNLEHNKE